MYDALESLVQAALLFAGIIALTAAYVVIARRYRGRMTDDRGDSSEMMSKFRELHEQGGLSDEEFRTIKTKLAGRLKAELNDNSGAG
jgi:uncharacterized membrane protein